MTSGEINALLTSRIEAHNIHDASALAATYASDCIVETVLAGTIYGRAAADVMFRHWFTAFPDFTLSSDEILSVGNRAVQCLTGRGTDTGGLLGQAPTGKPFQLQFVALFTLKDRLIAHERRVWDIVRFWRNWLEHSL